jgi:hypothetical protein
VAFEDTDGSILRSLLAEKYLYVHGHRATICKWKQRQPLHKDNLKVTTPEQTSESGSSKDEDEEDVEITLTPQPSKDTEQPSTSSGSLRETTTTAQTSQSNTNTVKTKATIRQPNPPCNAKGKACKVM